MATIVRGQPRYLASTIPNSEPLIFGSYRNGVGEGGAPHLKETASQTYKVGDLIYRDSNGTFAICGNTGNKLNTSIAGVAQKPATGVTGAPVMFHAIRNDERYIMNVYHSSAGSAVTAQTQLANNSGAGYGIILATNGTSNVWMVDIENTTVEDGTTALAKVSIVDFYTDYAFDTSGNLVKVAIGDTYGLVIVQFLRYTIATDGSPKTLNLQYDA